MLELVTNRNCVYQIGYHAIWTPKYRRPVLAGPVAVATEEILTDICSRKKWPIISLEIQIDHIHLFLSIPPSVSVASAIKVIKGGSALYLMRNFPELREKISDKHVWSPSYYIATSGNISAEIIKKYIERCEHIKKRK
ncbi:MAG: IS200/IS605 family transposase [Deltaproteobacteria bacterium]|jgi:putative transposase|nr:IS200/IS605 family transposase [Deltaproteobacteria bacterium]